MQTFTIRDLRDRTGEIVRDAEAGTLSVVTKHGQPVFVAVPFDENLLKNGVNLALAVHLFDEESISLGKAARLGGLECGGVHGSSGATAYSGRTASIGGTGERACFIRLIWSSPIPGR